MTEWWEKLSWRTRVLSMLDDSSKDLDDPVLEPRAKLLGTAKVHLTFSLINQSGSTDSVGGKAEEESAQRKAVTYDDVQPMTEDAREAMKSAVVNMHNTYKVFSDWADELQKSVPDAGISKSPFLILWSMLDHLGRPRRKSPISSSSSWTLSQGSRTAPQ